MVDARDKSSRVFRVICIRAIFIALVAIVAQPIWAVESTPSQQLIVACYKVQVEEVVSCIRKGANVNATFGDRAYDTSTFYDRWTGGTPLGAGSWTPLIALASSPAYPDPPAELGPIWKEAARSRELRKEIPPDVIEKRRNDAMAILYVLLSHRCNLEDDDGFGATALYKAVDKNKLLIAKALLDFGASPNTKTKVYIDGPGDTTPLHVACRSRELLQLLLSHGADGNARDSKGHRPADWVVLDPDRRFDLVETNNGWQVRDRMK